MSQEADRAAALPDVQLCRQWLSADVADALLSSLKQALPWERHVIRIFGREVPSPRLSCWVGDADAVYTYSRSRYEPRPWTAELQALRHRLERDTGGVFNSVLANWYRHGDDSMGWHADNEPELGARPLIASMSLGTTRRFLMRRREDHRDRHEWPLQHGDLLLMRGDVQSQWQHAVPKQRGAVGERINLTFRHVRPRD